ncbi:unnamed protein product [Periconia digitata]|uniref:Uncharacterized protein n=1 Tax=Periconia digitata TaxID=1303443 RepID=A0A9W4XJ81_9PLEO|nr:unnamed protein product [Periconia digitata]
MYRYILGWDPSFPHLTIILEGLIETALYRDKLHYHDRTPLLRHVTHLKHRQNGQVQQFAITIPERVQEGLSLLNRYSHSNNWTHDWSLQPPFEHTPNHPLPPSITVPRLTSTKLATSYSKASYKITYTLTAVLSPNSSSPLASSPPSQPPQQTTQLPLTLTTLRLPQSKLTLLKQALNTLSTPLSVQTTQLLKPKRLSLLEQLRDSFPTTSTPTFHFRATLSLPTLATPGAPLPLAIRVAVLPPPPGSHAYTFAIPDITVTRVDVRTDNYPQRHSTKPFFELLTPFLLPRGSALRRATSRASSVWLNM